MICCTAATSSCAPSAIASRMIYRLASRPRAACTSPANLSAYDPRAAAQFSRVQLPASDQRISPFVQLHAHRTDFKPLLDVETLGLQEDFRRGHDLLLRLYPASQSVGSTRTMLGSLAMLSYTVPIADGLIRPLVGSRIEYASHGRNDALFEGDLRFVSPRLGFGRLMLDGQILGSRAELS